MDAFTEKHLTAWLNDTFSEEVITHHNMLDRMKTVFESDPDYYGQHSWWETFAVTGIPRNADIPALEPLFGGEQQ